MPATLVAMIVRDGLGQFYAGQGVFTFPGIATLGNDGNWSVGDAALSAAGLRLRMEDADPEAYWSALAEGVFRLRVIGALDVVLGLGQAEYKRIGEPLRQIVKGRTGGNVVGRYGDHYALYSQPPWDSGSAPSPETKTVLLRVGAAQVQALVFAGSKLAQKEVWTPGWDEGVAFAGVRAGKQEDPRPDVHTASWTAVQSGADTPAVRAFGAQVGAWIQARAWSGTLVVTGIGSEVLQPYLMVAPLPFTKIVGGSDLEVKGLWNFGQQQRAQQAKGETR